VTQLRQRRNRWTSRRPSIHALHILASYDREGAAHVETAKIAEAMGCSEETAREALYGLVEKEFVEKALVERQDQP
jgi:DNA-binding IclR family transcriptional regulator